MDPAYEPCECDLTSNICDINCCCDPDCTSDDKLVFLKNCSLIPRNVINKYDIDPWYCNDIYNKSKINEENWFPIICINVI